MYCDKYTFLVLNIDQLHLVRLVGTLLGKTTEPCPSQSVVKCFIYYSPVSVFFTLSLFTSCHECLSSVVNNKLMPELIVTFRLVRKHRR